MHVTRDALNELDRYIKASQWTKHRIETSAVRQVHIEIKAGLMTLLSDVAVIVAPHLPGVLAENCEQNQYILAAFEAYTGALGKANSQFEYKREYVYGRENEYRYKYQYENEYHIGIYIIISLCMCIFMNVQV